MTSPTPKDLTVKNKFSLSKFLVKWEMILVYIFIIINIALYIGNPQTYNITTIHGTVQLIMSKAFMVFGIVLVLILGDIDVSIASIMAMSAMCMGLLGNAGLPWPVVLLGGLLAGAVCGAINGFLIARLKMSAVIVTISTSLLFRGIVKIVIDKVEGKKLSTYPSWFKTAGNGFIFDMIPISLACFLLFGIIFIVLLHKSRFGRKLYMIGNSYTASEYSGINVVNTKFLVFVIAGVMAAICAVFYLGYNGNQMNSSIGKGYELDVIAIAALGGVSPAGGKGKMYGPIIATFIMAFLDRAQGLLGIDENAKKVVTGVILIIAVIIPLINKGLLDEIKLHTVYRGNKNIQALTVNHKNEIRELEKEKGLLLRSSDHKKEEAAQKIAQIEKQIEEKNLAYAAKLKQLNLEAAQARHKRVPNK